MSFPINDAINLNLACGTQKRNVFIYPTYKKTLIYSMAAKSKSKKGLSKAKKPNRSAASSGNQRNLRIVMLLLILILLGSVIFTTSVVILKTSILSLLNQKVNKNGAATVSLNIIAPDSNP